MSAALDRMTIERALFLSGDAPILVALSGGGDSVALLHALKADLGAARLHACVVDHALRPGSAEDAQRATAFAEAAGIEVSIRTLQWHSGAKRAQADARAQRLAALAETARAKGARIIALGHTRDDQAETVLLRASRGSTWRGLAGMRAIAPAPVWPEGRGLQLMRPLLGARRAELRSLLRAQRLAWIEDPSNSNADFARVRVRARLAAWAEAGLDPMRFAAVAERLAPFAQKLDRDALALIVSAVGFEEDRALVACVDWCAPTSVRLRALSVLLAVCGGATREAEAEPIAALDARLADPDFKAATLGGAMISRAQGVLTLRRDPGALTGRADGVAALASLPLPANAEIVWDRRVALCAPGHGWHVCIEAGAPVLKREAERAAFSAAAPRWLLAERAAHMLGR